MPKASQYPKGKRTVRFLEAVGKQAEINPALPHILVPQIGTEVEVSAELAWVLVEKGRVVIVEDAQDPKPQADRRVSQEEGFVGTLADLRGSVDRRVSQEVGVVGSANDRRGVSQVEGEGDHPAQGDSERGSGGPLSWFRKRDAGKPEVAPEPVSPAAPEVAPEPVSPEAPEEPEGDQSDVAAEGDDADEGPNDPLS